MKGMGSAKALNEAARQGGELKHLLASNSKACDQTAVCHVQVRVLLYTVHQTRLPPKS
jgi:hypothetical protein